MTWLSTSRRRGRRSLGVRLWYATAGVTAGLGGLCALLVWGGGVWVYGLVAFAFLALLLAAHVDAPVVRRQVGMAGRIVVGSVVVAGLVAALGWAGVALLVLVVATHPAVVSRVSRALAPASPAATSEGENDPEPRPSTWLPEAESVGSLDDETLCQAWRRSFVWLSTCRLPSRRLEIVHLRQAYLDELERRHPAAVQRWLTSGARAASNPMPFVAPFRGSHDDGRERS